MTDKHPSRCICSECQDEALATELQSDKARIAELERENTRLREQLDAGTEAGWHALRNERDELRRQIERAVAAYEQLGNATPPIPRQDHIREIEDSMLALKNLVNKYD